MGAAGRHAGHHHGAGAPAEGVLQEPGELRVAKGDMGVPRHFPRAHVGEHGNHVAQARQRLVDGSQLLGGKSRTRRKGATRKGTKSTKYKDKNCEIIFHG